MGREVRMVPSDWQHPKDDRGRYKPMHGGSFAKDAAEWDAENAKWGEGLRKDYSSEFDGSGWKPREKDDGDSFEDWSGTRPDSRDYMPDWPAERRTHFMMYETTSEGTPISPAFATPGELARWLADTRASTFADMTATYEQWLPICQGGFAPSMIMDSKGLRSGVEAAADINAEPDAE